MKQSARPWHIAALALAIWLAVAGLLGGGIAGALSFAVQMGVCFLVGYAICSFLWSEIRPQVIIVATVLGVEIAASAYAMTRFWASSTLHLFLIGACAALGAYRLAQVGFAWERRRVSAADAMLQRLGLWSGLIVMIFVGSAFYFSGRPGIGGLVFFGPMGRDPIFHLALIGRLEFAMPPDNFVVAGYPMPSYHFFSDVAQALFHWGFWQSAGTLDIYYRLYPGALLFALGFLVFWVPAKLYASRIAGTIGAALVLFGADFSWVLGILQTGKALPHPALAVQRLFDPWVFWSAFSQIYPLVHRPAYYHGLLMLLAGLACVTGRGAHAKRSWPLAGLIWGLMAGFNYTLAATLGIALVGASGFYFVRSGRDRARQLMLAAVTLALASVPANIFVLLRGGLVENAASPLVSFAPGALARLFYGDMLAPLHADLLILPASILVFIVVSYGLKLVALPWMFNGTERFRSNAPAMTVLLIVFVISFALGFLVMNESYGDASTNIILFQPTGWVLGLFAVYPLYRWLKRGRTLARPVALSFLLSIGAIQAIAAFNFGYKIVIAPDFAAALARIKGDADPMDVVAFLPDGVNSKSILGDALGANNFYVSALTGLKAYFTTRAYTQSFSTSGASGAAVYEERSGTIEKFLSGAIADADVELLIRQGVRYVILPVQFAAPLPAQAAVWISSAEFTVLKLKAP
jgi:hypothetical protein